METQKKIDYYILGILTIVAIFSTFSLISKYNNGYTLVELTDHYLLAIKTAVTTTRSYVITNDITFKNEYLKLLNIRNADGNWDDLFPSLSEDLKNNTSTSSILFKKYCNETGYKMYEDFSLVERKILWESVVAINSSDGFIDEKDEMKNMFDSDNSIQFIKFKKKMTKQEQEKSRNKDIQILFGDSFLKTVQELDDKIREFAIYNNSIISNNIKSYKNILYVSFVLLLAYLIYIIIRK